MVGIQVGQVCVKTTGRSAGKKVIVVGIEKDGFVIVEGLDVKRKRCNPLHLFVTPQVADISKSAKREEVVAALK